MVRCAYQIGHDSVEWCERSGWCGVLVSEGLSQLAGQESQVQAPREAMTKPERPTSSPREGRKPELAVPGPPGRPGEGPDRAQTGPDRPQQAPEGGRVCEVLSQGLGLYNSSATLTVKSQRG